MDVGNQVTIVYYLQNDKAENNTNNTPKKSEDKIFNYKLPNQCDSRCTEGFSDTYFR